MKRQFFIIILFSLTSSALLGQFMDNRKHYSLADTVFDLNTYYISKIHFDLAQPDIRDESKPTLDSIAVFLIKNKKLSIEVGCHADTRGKPTSSRRLTKARANNIVNYLIAKGIDSARIKAVGYEGTLPIISSKQIAKLKTEKEIEEAHFLNRRVDFKIIGK